MTAATESKRDDGPVKTARKAAENLGKVVGALGLEPRTR